MKRLADAIDLRCTGMHRIVSRFIREEERDENKTRQADGKAGRVDDRRRFIALQMTDRHGEEMPQYVSCRDRRIRVVFAPVSVGEQRVKHITPIGKPCAKVLFIVYASLKLFFQVTFDLFQE